MIRKLVRKFTLTAMLVAFATGAFANQDMINVASSHAVVETADKLEKIFLSKGMKVFQRIKHSEGAKNVGVELNPTELIIFGNPKIGSPLMKCAQTVAIDLPQKALVWQDDNKKVWITYNDPMYLKQRHNIQGCDKVLEKVSGALSKMTGAAAK